MRSELVSFTAHYFRGSDKDYRLIISSCRAFTITAVAQLCVLGTTWIFGCFQFGDGPSAMSYVFTILNSLQGVLLFVMHCLLYKPVCTWFAFNYLGIYQNWPKSMWSNWSKSMCIYLRPSLLFSKYSNTRWWDIFLMELLRKTSCTYKEKWDSLHSSSLNY